MGDTNAPAPGAETKPAAPAAPAATETAKPNGAAAPDGPWYAPFGLPKEDSDYIEGKGARDLPTLIKQTRDFEKVARDRNVLEKPDPKALKDWKGWSELGWVEDAAKYQIKAPDEGKYKFGRDNALWDAVQKAGHDERVPLPALQRLHDTVMEHWNAQLARVEGEGAKALEATQAELRRKWGADYDTNMELAKRTASTLARAVGVDEFKKLEEAVGGAPALSEMFARIGAGISEDRFVDGGGGAGVLTPEGARAERLKLEADREFMKSLTDERHPLHAGNTARRLRLIEVEARGQK